EIEVDVPCSVAYQCYSERETIPQWMPFISTVKVLEDKPELSRWTLKYAILGRDVEFSWLARNMTVSIYYDKAATDLGVNIQLIKLSSVSAN
uniref:Coenzyme Q-binding protein COQ10 START domain-containing protein n=1 Tax=Aegilops tauschii subsp. strangulata TaxID=200361 RepID=A0A453FDF3_AEGTS